MMKKRAISLILFLGFFALSAWKEELIIPEHTSASADTFTPPVRTRGETRLDVKNYGAVGNGIKDDTKAFQNAINALPADGGTVVVPAGNYLITTDFRNADKSVKGDGYSIKLRSNMHLELSPEATLIAKPNKEKAYAVIYAQDLNNVEISGGKIVGDRDQHMGTEGEWGHGVMIKACNQVTVRNMHISNCWGDGIDIGGKSGQKSPLKQSDDVVISNVICTNNRRQGLSITEAKNIQVWNSEFNNTNGTAPQCGIDIEPARGNDAQNIHIENCSMLNNHAYGILVFKRIKNVTIKNCKMAGNSLGIVCDAPADAYISFNEIHNNRKMGLLAKDSTNTIKLFQNTFYENNGNPARPAALKIAGVSSETTKDMLIQPGVSNLTVDANIYK